MNYIPQVAPDQAPTYLASVASAADFTPWPSLNPFDSFTPPPVTLDAFPPWLRRFILALAESTQTPVALAMSIVLAVLATALQGRFVVKLRPDWKEPLCLFLIVSLPPGSRKSPVFSVVVGPVEEYEAMLLGPAKTELAKAEAENQNLKARMDYLKRKAAAGDADAAKECATLHVQLETQTVPVLPRLIADDITPERLAGMIAEQNGRMAILSAETSFIEILAGRYSDGKATQEVVLKAHCGEPIRTDRMSRADRVAHAHLTLGLTVQPALLHGLMSDKRFRGRGLLARFLCLMPENTVGRRAIDPPPLPDDLLSDYRAGILQLLRLSDTVANDGEKTIRLSPAAAGIFKEFRARLEPQLAENGTLGHVADWAAKLPGAVARIAALLHVAHHHDETALWERTITPELITEVIRLAEDHLIPHALAVFDQMELSEDSAHARALHDLLSRKYEPGAVFQTRDLTRNSKRFRDQARLTQALHALEERGFIRPLLPDPNPGKGRPASPAYQMRPDVDPETYRNYRDTAESLEVDE